MPNKNEKDEKVMVPLKKVLSVFEELLRSNKIKYKKEMVYKLVRFANRDGIVDYKYLIKVFRNRAENMTKF